MTQNTSTEAPATNVIDLKPGSRVRCYDAFNGTVVRVVNVTDPYAIVRYDGSLRVWNDSVYPAHLQAI